MAKSRSGKGVERSKPTADALTLSAILLLPMAAALRSWLVVPFLKT
jgi:hypothetical protein